MKLLLILFFLICTSCSVSTCKIDITYQNGDTETLFVQMRDDLSPYIDDGCLVAPGSGTTRCGVRSIKYKKGKTSKENL